MAVTKKTPSFEAALAELEQIVEKMESGELALEESLEAYARGTELVGMCRRKLDAAQAKIQKLESDGRLTEFTPESGAL